MMKSLFVTWLILIGWVLAGCSPTAPTGEATSVPSKTEPASLEPATSPLALTPSPAECQFTEERLTAWAKSLPFEDSALFPQTYQGQSSLNLWLMNPSLAQASPEEISTWAADSAFLALNQLSVADNCVLSFDSYFVTVVDPLYQVWFSGSIRQADLASATQIDQNSGSGEVGGGKIIPTAENSLTGGGKTCRWGDVARTLKAQFTSPEQYAAFMLLRDGAGTNLSAYLTLSQPPTDENITQMIATIYDNTGCLQNQLNGISITFTLPKTQLVLTGFQPLRPGEGYDPADLTFTRFDAP